jgi:carbonic anhydrase/acetyltransferase-like protein (isoleucine patch superfamily)
MIKRFKGVLPRVAETAFVEQSAQVVGDVEIGEHASVWFNTVVRGDVHFIKIGRYSNVQDCSVVHVTGEKHPVTIGDYVTIGHNAIVHGCTIQDGCLIGMGAIILDGATIGEGALVAAGAVIRESQIVPPRVLVAGVPAKVIRELTAEEIRRVDENWREYVDLKNLYLRNREELSMSQAASRNDEHRPQTEVCATFSGEK